MIMIGLSILLIFIIYLVITEGNVFLRDTSTTMMIVGSCVKISVKCLS